MMRRVEIVQFHPSYAYEDFVEGYRPPTAPPPTVEAARAVHFELKPGPLRRLAEAPETSEAAGVLLIDEINRGNIAKVFGELYYLLEYRDEPIEPAVRRRRRSASREPLHHRHDEHRRPVHRAARRRASPPLPLRTVLPRPPPIQGLLRRWLSQRRPGMDYVADLVDRANAQLPDRHLQIGPSYFMTSRLDDQWLRKIWRASVIPYLEEQFFDEPQRVEEFALDRLLPRDMSTEAGDAEITDLSQDDPPARVATDSDSP